MPNRSFLTGAKPATQFANGTRISTTGLNGTLSQWVETSGAFRTPRLPAEVDVNPAFLTALRELEILELETLYLEVPRTAEATPPPGPAVNDLVTLDPAKPAAAAGVMLVLYQDESGGLSWHFPDGFQAPPGSPAPAFRGPAGTRFTISARTRAAQGSLAANRPPHHLRGPITKIGRKIFKVLFVPLLGPLLAEPVRKIAEHIERKHRQNLVRPVTPENYNRPVNTPFTDWAALDGQRALLIVHGIFSSTHGMLSGYPAAEMKKLCDGYRGRVIALDQFTVTMSPEDNARFFLDAAKAARPEGKFDFDILCHSRGGVVSRVLVERGELLVPGHNCRFGKVYFVAAPNAGSPLGDAAHMVDMLDVFTNLATKLPDGMVAYSIEVLLALLKLTAYTAITQLPGIAAMGTAGYIRDTLNQATEPASARYAASAADYEPVPAKDNGFLVDRLGNAAIDRVFESEGEAVANDLVVPTHGVWAANGHPSFPITDHVLYSTTDGVLHTGYFASPKTQEHIMAFFELGGPPANWMASMAGMAVAGAEAEFDAPAQEMMEGGSDGPLPPPVRRFRSFGPASVPPSHPNTVTGGFKMALPPDDDFGLPPTGPELPEAVAMREPHIDFHEAIDEGQESPLTVRLEDLTGKAAADLGRTMEFHFGAGQETVMLEVLLLAPGFDVVPPAECRIRVGRQRDAESEKLVFLLTPRSPGSKPATREIRAEFWLNNSCVGSVLHRTVVHPKGYTGPRSGDGSTNFSAVNVPAVRREDCDLVLIVEGMDESGQPPFQLRLQCAVPGHEYAAKYVGKLSGEEAGKPLGEYINQTIDEEFRNVPLYVKGMEAAYEKAFADWEESFKATLLALGKRLWSWLPDRLRDEYFRLIDAQVPVRSILVHSDEMMIPWELLVPSRLLDKKLQELKPLGQAHILGRWKPGLAVKPQPQHFTVRNFAILNPVYPPPDELTGAAEEAVELLKIFPGATRITPSSLATVRQLLARRDDIQLLHLSCHGEYVGPNADLSSLILEGGGRLKALDLNSTKLVTEGTPFIYLNACSVGAAGEVAGRMGGFADVLLQSGCSGLIAPYWKIDDVTAKQFSLALYAKLMTGIAVGEALQELRVENSDNVTYCAFALYGDPWTRLNLQPVMGG